MNFLPYGRVRNLVYRVCYHQLGGRRSKKNDKLVRELQQSSPQTPDTRELSPNQEAIAYPGYNQGVSLVTLQAELKTGAVTALFFFN